MLGARIGLKRTSMNCRLMCGAGMAAWCRWVKSTAGSLLIARGWRCDDRSRLRKGRGPVARTQRHRPSQRPEGPPTFDLEGLRDALSPPEKTKGHLEPGNAKHPQQRTH
jgi:hypothetical protein